MNKTHPVTGKELFPLISEEMKTAAIKNVKVTIHMFPRQS